MQKLPSVSVVIPVFNRRDRVLAAAANALEQTTSPLEVIIADDGSTDGIENIDFAAVDCRVHLIRHFKNKGGGAARNTGIDAAKGDWVALLDSDDLWVPDKLEIQFARIEEERTGSEMVAASNVLVRRPGRSDFLYNRHPPAAGIRLCEYFLIHRATFQTSTLLLPTSLAREVRFDERLRRHQDWDFLLRLERRGVQFIYIHEPLAIYDDTPDTSRVSQARDPAPTLRWYDIAGDNITPRAKHIHYMRTQFMNQFRRDKKAAIKTLLTLTLSYPLGPLYAAGHIFHLFNRVLDRLRRLASQG